MMGSCPAGTVAGDLLLASVAPRDSLLQLPLYFFHLLPEPWQAGKDTGGVRRESYAQAWAGVGASHGAAAGVVLQLQHGENQTWTLLPVLPGGGHGVVVVVWGLVVEQELEEWGHDVEAEWV